MKTRLCRLEFGIASMADLRFLYKAWDRFWATEDQEVAESIMIYLTMEDRVPGDEVCLNFTASPEALDRFLGILEQDGLKFTRNDFIAGLLIMCRVVHDRAGLTVIGAKSGHDPGGRQEG